MSLNRKPLKTDEDEMRLVQTPRKYPLPVPLAGVFDAPYKLILCNVEWFSHVSGMIDVLSALDAWLGDDDEKTRGIREIAKLLSTDWSAMFVEDIRYNEEDFMLEFFKAGTWHEVTDFNLLYDYINQAWGKADDAQTRVGVVEGDILAITSDVVSLNASQVAQDDRLDAIEALQATHDTSIANLSTDMEAAEDAIDALDARLDALEALEFWTHTWDFTASDFGIIPTNATYTSGQGFVHLWSGFADVLLQNMQTGANANQIYAMEVGYSFQSGNTGAPTNAPEQRLNGISPYAKIRFTGTGGVGEGLIKAHNNPSANYELGVQDFGDYTITYVKFFGIGDNPF